MFINKTMKTAVVGFFVISVLTGCQDSSSKFKSMASTVFNSTSEMEEKNSASSDPQTVIYKKKELAYKSFKKESVNTNIRTALSNNFKVLSKLASVDAAQEDIEISQSFEKLQSSATVTAGMVSENRDTEAAAAVVLSTNKILFDFGVTSAQINIAEASFELAKLDALMKAEEVALNGFEVWVSFAKAKQINDVYQVGLELANPLLGQIKNISVSGVADKTQLLAAKEKYTKLQTGADEAKSMLKVARTNFLNYFKVSEIIELEQLDGITFPSNSAIQRNKMIQYQLLSKKVLDEKIKALQGKEKPSISLSSRVTAPVKDTLDEGNANAGLLITYIFNDGGRNDSEIKKVEAEIAALDNEGESFYFELEKQFSVLEEQYKLNQSKKDSMVELRELAEDVSATAKAQLVSGRSSITDVMNAEVSLADSKIQLIITKADLAIASYRAYGILGDLLPHIGWEITQIKK
jgi:outer membrane protein TolC